MIADFQPYPLMKESGVKWLEDVPEHWEVRRLKTVSSVQISSVDRETKEGEKIVRFLGTDTVYRTNRITKNTPLEASSATDAQIERFALRAGDVIITKDSIVPTRIAIPSIVDEDLPDLSICGYHLALLRPFNNSLTADYLFYTLLTPNLSSYFITESKGVTIIGISHDEIGCAPLPLPALPEQVTIVRFLDYADRCVRRYVRDKQKLIVLLEEQKQAIIHRAVTRGLNSEIPLKPSGVEWLGDVPEHWEVKRAKYLFREVDHRTSTGKEVLLSLRMFQGLVPHKDVSSIPITEQDLIGFKKIEPGQLVMNRMRAAIGMFGIAHQSGLVSPDYAILEQISDIDPEYYLRLFKTPAACSVFRIESKGLGTGSSGFMRLYTDRFGRIKLPVPPVEEQRQIVETIAEITQEIERTKVSVHREIELIGEYRTRLIADVVTGKLDVREVEASLSDEPDEFEQLNEINDRINKQDDVVVDLDDLPEETKV